MSSPSSGSGTAASSSASSPASEFDKAHENKPYYDIAYQLDSFTITVPFLLALAIFYIAYLIMFRSQHHRIRSKKLVSK